jgi:predicted DNA-binding transcriptional regulator YafY
MKANTCDYDRRIHRFIGMLNLAGQGDGIRVSECARRYNVSLRTVQRDIEMLVIADFPLVAKARGVYAFVEGFSLKKLQLTSEEASLLAVFGDISRSLGKQYTTSFRGIMAKLTHPTPDSPVYVKLSPVSPAAANCKCLSEIQHAITAHHYCTIHYVSINRDKDYRLKPLKIALFDGFWYVWALLPKHKRVHKFRLDKITSCDMHEETFIPPKNIQKILDESHNIMYNATGTLPVTLRISKEKAQYFKEKAYFPRQRIVRTCKDGSLELVTKVADYNEITRIILSWIPHIRVVRPISYARELENMLKQYCLN